jgi:predicted transcriptional regulator
MRKEYRSKAKIMADILEAVMKEGRGRPSKIMMDANISYDRMSRYLELLTEKGLLENVEAEGIYKITQDGVRFLEEFRRFEKLARVFGLEL